MNQPGDLDAEIRATRGRVLGEAAWSRLAQRANQDPKDPRYQQLREATVETIGAALMVLEESGFEGLVDWLDLEEDAK